MDEDAFLVNPDTGHICQLNEIAAAVWHLLDQPMSVERIVAQFREAFSDIDGACIERDIASLLGNLARHRLIHETSPAN